MSKAKKAPEKDKPVVTTASFIKEVTALVPHDEDGERELPSLTEGMLPQYKDGKMTRQRGTLRIRVEGHLYEVTLAMPTEKLQTTLMVSSITECLSALDRHLASGEAIWKPVWTPGKKTLPTVDDLL